tara:strand:+ start:73 stop:330 length:258 start_codon:yes stop_codon:yes gene_type:complete
MALNIVDLYSQEYISKLGTEYICTGYMFEISETKKTLGEQVASFDFIGVTSDKSGVDLGVEYNMSPSGQQTDYSAGGQTGGMGGY